MLLSPRGMPAIKRTATDKSAIIPRNTEITNTSCTIRWHARRAPRSGALASRGTNNDVSAKNRLMSAQYRLHSRSSKVLGHEDGALGTRGSRSFWQASKIPAPTSRGGHYMYITACGALLHRIAPAISYASGRVFCFECTQPPSKLRCTSGPRYRILPNKCRPNRQQKSSVERQECWCLMVGPTATPGESERASEIKLQR